MTAGAVTSRLLGQTDAAVWRGDDAMPAPDVAREARPPRWRPALGLRMRTKPAG